ncbi:fimbrial protein [Shewanella cutis]|uniref:Fimbrial protein n=1 Tax=Shewanella cutis TaxID=2766780 RepID=A0ABS9R0V4_9GAMM|nr:fimbrial protein [Shewanella sp. PS-2]MCG9966231.1 fimbrial protein [Shewanella sp. PS-2]
MLIFCIRVVGEWLLKGMLINFIMLFSFDIEAACQRISTVTTNPNDPSYVNPNYGLTTVWYGAYDANRGSLNLPVIQVAANKYQPNGTLLATAVVPFIIYAQTNGYHPETVLYRCEASDEGKLYEYYSTNGDNEFGGYYEDGFADGVAYGYATYIKNIVVRIRNNTSNKYFSRHWQRRALADLDRDEKGRILVKAKNFTDITIEIFRIRDVRGQLGDTNGYISGYTYNQPAGYIAFGGPGVNHPTEGLDHASHWPGFYGEWPGNISLYQQLIVRRTTLIGNCSVINSTPIVRLPLITVNELNSGQTADTDFQLRYECQGNALTGTKPGQFAMGFKINSASFSDAWNMNLRDYNAVSHLLSDGYGRNNNLALGVAVILEREDGLTQPFMIKDYPDLVSTYDAYKDGWRTLSPYYSLVNGNRIYTQNYKAKLVKLSGRNVTAGRYLAQAQIIVRLQ